MLAIPFFIWAAAIAVVGFNSYWADSELWAVVATQHFGEPDYYFASKPLFHFLLSLNFRLAEALGLHPMDTARVFMALNFFAMLAAIANLLRRLEVSPALGVALLLSISFFVKGALDVRSDLIVTNLYLWWIYAGSTRRWSAITFGITVAVAALISPKSVFWALACWPFLPTQHRRKAYAIGAAGLIVMCFVFQAPLLFFLRSIVGDESSEGYFSFLRWIHVLRFMRENPHLILLLAVAPWLKGSAPTDEARRVRAMSWTLIAALAVYPDRLPFMITSLVPFMILLVATYRRVLPPPNARLILASLMALASLHWILSTRAHNNERQKEVVQWLHEELKRLPPLEIFDPNGILYAYPAHHWFLGPSEPVHNQAILERVQELQPEIFMMTPKTGFLGPELNKYLAENFSVEDSGLLVGRIMFVPMGGAIDCHLLRLQLAERFPRLFGTEIDWFLYARDEVGVQLKEKVTHKLLTECRELPIPLSIDRVAVTPFELPYPFEKTLFQLFAFDAGF